MRQDTSGSDTIGADLSAPTESHSRVRYGTEDGLDPNTVLLRQAAERAGVPASVQPVPNAFNRPPKRGLRLTIQGCNYFYRFGVLQRGGPADGRVRHINGVALSATQSKGVTKALLAAAGAPVPEGRVFDDTQLAEAVNYALGLGRPVCVKPDVGSKGTLVVPRCTGPEAVTSALKAVFRHFKAAVVEESVPGGVYRFFYVAPEIVGVRISRALGIAGDGRSTVGQLIDSANEEREQRRLPGHDPVTIDHAMVRFLASIGHGLTSVPPRGVNVPLSPVSNFARGGGESVNLGDGAIHPSYEAVGLMAFHAIEGLQVGAIDLTIVDPDKPAAPGNCWILEVNSSPSIETFHHPWEGAPQDVAGALLSLLMRDAARLTAKGSTLADGPQGDPDLDPHALLLQKAAARAGVETRIVTLSGYGARAPRRHLRITAASGRSYDFRRGALRLVSDLDPSVPGAHINGHAVRLTSSKKATKAALAAAGLSVPMGRTFNRVRLNAAVAYAAALEGSVRVKPNQGGKEPPTYARGRDSHAVAAAFCRVAQAHDEVLVERTVTGEELKFFYVEPRVVAVTCGVAPVVVGDGARTILELIKRRNREDASERLADRPLIALGPDLALLLAEQGLELLSVAGPGVRVLAGRPTRSPSDGVAMVESQSSVDLSYCRVAEAAFRALPGIRIGSLEMTVLDRRAPAAPNNHWILEMHSSPALVPFHAPWRGEPQDVSGEIIRFLQSLGES